MGIDELAVAPMTKVDSCEHGIGLLLLLMGAVEQFTRQTRHTGCVADYKAVFDLLVAQTTLPMEARIFFWNQALKPMLATLTLLLILSIKTFLKLRGLH